MQKITKVLLVQRLEAPQTNLSEAHGAQAANVVDERIRRFARDVLDLSQVSVLVHLLHCQDQPGLVLLELDVDPLAVLVAPPGVEIAIRREVKPGSACSGTTRFVVS